MERGKGRRRWLTVPNLLSLFRLLVVPLFVISALREEFLLAFGLFLTAAITDAVDGWVARRFDQRSTVGLFLDPAADKLLMVSGYVVMTLPDVGAHRLPIWLTFTVFARDVLIVLFAYLLYTRIQIRRFPPSVIGKVSTIVQVVALAVTIAANTLLAPLALPLLWLVHAVAFAMTLLSGWDYIRRWNAVVLSEG